MQMFSFPAIAKEHRGETMGAQLQKIAEEYGEAYEEAAKDSSTTRLAVELFDIIHATETALRMIYEDTPGAVVGAFFMVKQKNEARGYYGEES